MSTHEADHNTSAADEIIDEREPGFFIIDDEVIENYGASLGPLGVAVYNVLVKHAGRGRSCFPSYATIAELLGIDRKTAIKGVGLLLEAKLIGKSPRMDDAGDPTSNSYRILPVRKKPAPEAETRAPVVSAAPALIGRGGREFPPPPGGNNSLPVVENFPHGGGKFPPEPDPSNQTHPNHTHTARCAPRAARRPPHAAGVCVPVPKSAFDVETRRAYALAHTLSITKPEQWVWSKRAAGGEFDEAIRDWLTRGKPTEGSGATAKPPDASACPDCAGSGHYFTDPKRPETHKLCTHPRLADGRAATPTQNVLSRPQEAQANASR